MLATEVPIDSLVREMKRGRSYTLGLGRATPLTAEIARTWPGRVASSLHAKTHRSTLLIETDLSESHGNDMGFSGEDPEITRITWTIGRESDESNPARNRQAMKDLGALPKWKEQYPLVVLHLGCMDSQAFEILGKLCDGIALAADMSRSPMNSLRDLSRSLRHHQAHGCRLLGMWSVEIG